MQNLAEVILETLEKDESLKDVIRQCVTYVINGSYPCSREKAIEEAIDHYVLSSNLFAKYSDHIKKIVIATVNLCSKDRRFKSPEAKVCLPSNVDILIDNINFLEVIEDAIYSEMLPFKKIHPSMSYPNIDSLNTFRDYAKLGYRLIRLYLELNPTISIATNKKDLINIVSDISIAMSNIAERIRINSSSLFMQALINASARIAYEIASTQES